MYSTYLGLGGNNSASGIVVDQDLNAYIAGQSHGYFYTTASAYQPVYGGGDWDAVAAKFNACGSDLIYATFLGREETDRGAALPWMPPATPMSPAAPWRANFPITPGVTQPTMVGFTVAFVTKINAGGSDLEYSTFLGGGDHHDAGRR